MFVAKIGLKRRNHCYTASGMRHKEAVFRSYSISKKKIGIGSLAAEDEGEKK